MCDESKLDEWARATISRRQFGALTGAAALAACASGESAGNAQSPIPGLKEKGVTFATTDGTMDGFLVQPERGKHPAAILWPDIASIRESKRMIARKLASAGYAVLVVNPYYRDVAGEQFADFAGFIAGGGFQKVGPWRKKLDAAAIMRDASAIVPGSTGRTVSTRPRASAPRAIAWAGPSPCGAQQPCPVGSRPRRVSMAAVWCGPTIR